MTMSFCTNCGAKLESTQFCTQCGTPIQQPPQQISQQSTGQGQVQPTVGPLSKLVLACPKCQRPIGLPESTYGTGSCACGFKFRFRAQKSVGCIVRQGYWVPPPKEDPEPGYHV